MFIGRDLPVLNEEGNLISVDGAKGSWISDSSTPEVHIPIIQLTFCILVCLSRCLDMVLMRFQFLSQRIKHKITGEYSPLTKYEVISR